MLIGYIYIWRSHSSAPIIKGRSHSYLSSSLWDSTAIMLALSPSSWFPTFGWPSDDNIGQDQNRWTEDYDHPFINYNREIDGLDSCFRISSPQLMGAIDGPKISPATSEDISPNLKKMSHNANERERRKKLNSLYSTLRSLLPVSDQKVGVNLSVLWFCSTCF